MIRTTKSISRRGTGRAARPAGERCRRPGRPAGGGGAEGGAPGGRRRRRRRRWRRCSAGEARTWPAGAAVGSPGATDGGLVRAHECSFMADVAGVARDDPERPEPRPAPRAGQDPDGPFVRRGGTARQDGTVSRKPPVRDVDEDDLEVDGVAHAAAGPKAVAVTMKRAVEQMGVRRTAQTLRRLNQVDGFDCQGCAWPDPDPEHRHAAEFCENGAKAVAEEATLRHLDRSFFAAHPMADLADKTDYWLGQQGRITEPMVLRAGGDALRADRLGRGVRAGRRAPARPGARRTRRCSTPPARRPTRRRSPTSCSSGAFGTNNLPDCSNMCHESTSVGLAETIGIGKGSVSLEDVHRAELIVIAGQNPGTNHPRMLSALEKAKKNGARIIAVNPLREAGLVKFRNPQTPRGWVGPGTPLADLHLPIRLNGDLALFQAIGSLLLEWDAVDHDFVGEAHDRLRRVGRARRRPRLGRRTPRDRADPRAGRGDRRDVPGLEGHRHLLGDGHHPAPQRGRDGQGVRQRRAAPGQHRQAGRRPVPGARPLQRPGRPDHGHLGAAQAGVPRRARSASSASTRRASPASTRSRRSRRSGTAGPGSSSRWAATSSRRSPTPTSPRTRCGRPT